MANEQNLKPIRKGQLSKEELKKRQSNGGKKSGQVRREKRAMQDLARDILNMAISDGELDDVENLSDIVRRDKKGNIITGDDGKPLPKNLTVQQMSLISQARKAVKGDAKALEFLRDTAGERPVERVEMKADITEAVDEVGSILDDLEAADGS